MKNADHYSDLSILRRSDVTNLVCIKVWLIFVSLTAKIP